MNNWFGLGIMLQVNDNMSMGLINAMNSFNEFGETVDRISNSSGQSMSLIEQNMMKVQSLAIGGMGLQQLGNTLAGVGNSILSPFVNLGKSVIATGSQFEQYRATLNALYKDSELATAKANEAMNLAAKTPFEVQDVMEALIGFKAINVEALDLYEGLNGEARTLLEYIGDLAALRPDIGLQGVLMGVRNLLGGDGGRSLQMRMDIDFESILGESWGSTSEEMIDQLVRASQMIADGLMGELEGTWQQRISNLEDQLTRFSLAIADGGMFKSIGDSLGYFSDKIASIDDDKLARIGSNIANAFSTIWKPIDFVIRKLTDFSMVILNLIETSPLFSQLVVSIGAVIGIVLTVTGLLSVFGGTVLLAKAGIMALRTSILMLPGTMTALVPKIMSFIGTFGKLSLIGGGIYLALKNDMGGIRTLLTDFMKNMHTAFNESARISKLGVNDMLQSLSELDTTTFGGWLTYRLTQIRVFWEALCDAWNDYTLSDENFQKVQELGLLPLLETILDVKLKAEAFFEGFKTGIQNVSDVVVPIFKKVCKVIGDIIMFLFPVKEGVDDFNESGKNLDLKPWSDLGESVAYAVSAIGGLLLINKVIKVVSGVGSAIWGTITTITGAFGTLMGFLKNYVLMPILTGVGLIVTSILGAFGIIVTAPAWVVGAITVALALIVGLIIAKWDEIVAITKELWGKVCEFFSGIWDSICEFVSGVVDTVKEKWNGIVESTKEIWGSICDFFSELCSSIGGFFSSLWDSVCQVTQTIWDWIYSNIIQPIATRIGGVCQIILGVFQIAWGLVTGVVKLAWNIIKAIIMTGVEIIKAIVTPIINFFKTVWDTISSVVSVVWDFIVSLIKSAWETVKNCWNSATQFFSELWNAISTVVSIVWNAIVDFIKLAYENVTTWWNNAIQFFTDLWNIVWGVIQTVWDLIVGIIKSAFDTVSSIWSTITQFFSDLWNGIYNNIISPVWELIKSLITNVYNTVTSVWDGAKGIFSSIWETIKSVASPIWEGIQSIINTVYDTVVSTWNGITGIFSGIWNSITESATGFFNWLGEKFSWVSGIIDGVKNAFGSIGSGISNGLSNIVGGAKKLVGLNTGGYVKTEGIAMLHPNEVVVNDDLTQKLRTFLGTQSKQEPMSTEQANQNFYTSNKTSRSFVTENSYINNNTYNQNSDSSSSISKLETLFGSFIDVVKSFFSSPLEIKEPTLVVPIPSNMDVPVNNMNEPQPQIDFDFDPNDFNPKEDNKPNPVFNQVANNVTRSMNKTDNETTVHNDNSVVFEKGAIQLTLTGSTMDEREAEKFAKMIMQKIQRQQQLERTRNYKPSF